MPWDWLGKCVQSDIILVWPIFSIFLSFLCPQSPSASEHPMLFHQVKEKRQQKEKNKECFSDFRVSQLMVLMGTNRWLYNTLESIESFGKCRWHGTHTIPYTHNPPKRSKNPILGWEEWRQGIQKSGGSLEHEKQWEHQIILGCFRAAGQSTAFSVWAQGNNQTPT